MLKILEISIIHLIYDDAAECATDSLNLIWKVQSLQIVEFDFVHQWQELRFTHVYQRGSETEQQKWNTWLKTASFIFFYR